ncbi:MAG TPA: hypothetical protein VHD38_03090 [Candidatus Paceibacterota bacterium]|nr:hypothetical protein [Candidatus Paceibacterota bacterium]
MKMIALAAALCAAALLAPIGAQAQDQSQSGTEQSQNCAPDCGTHIKKVRVRGRQIGEKTVPVYEYHTKKVRVKNDCCAPPPQKPVQVQEPAPERVVVKKKIYVIEQPEIIRVPAPPVVVRPVCCPPGVVNGLPPCPPNGSARVPGYNTAALGTPGGGYVDGAPRSAAECRARGGIDTGSGCRGYH